MTIKKRLKSRASGRAGKASFWLKGLERRGAPLDERALAIFQPDVLIEPQYLSTYRGRFHLGPEHVLMLAVLQDAVGCFQEHATAACKRRLAMHRDAEQWILSSDRSYLFSFECVCEALGYDADYMRQGLLRWKEAACGQRKRLRPRRFTPAKRSAGMAFERSAVGHDR